MRFLFTIILIGLSSYLDAQDILKKRAFGEKGASNNYPESSFGIKDGSFYTVTYYSGWSMQSGYRGRNLIYSDTNLNIHNQGNINTYSDFEAKPDYYRLKYQEIGEGGFLDFVDHTHQIQANLFWGNQLYSLTTNDYRVRLNYAVYINEKIYTLGRKYRPNQPNHSDTTFLLQLDFFGDTIINQGFFLPHRIISYHNFQYYPNSSELKVVSGRNRFKYSLVNNSIIDSTVYPLDIRGQYLKSFNYPDTIFQFKLFENDSGFFLKYLDSTKYCFDSIPIKLEDKVFSDFLSDELPSFKLTDSSFVIGVNRIHYDRMETKVEPYLLEITKKGKMISTCYIDASSYPSNIRNHVITHLKPNSEKTWLLVGKYFGGDPNSYKSRIPNYGNLMMKVKWGFDKVTPDTTVFISNYSYFNRIPYPNPTNNELFLNGFALKEVYNINGEFIPIDKKGYKISFDRLPRGLYFLKSENGLTQKVFVQ